jgi:carboxymethylenebutenolidase
MCICLSRLVTIYQRLAEENVVSNYITINGRNGSFKAYIAKPKSTPASAVIVLQELFGVNADIRQHCDELCAQGYIAVAPDLYWAQERGVDLSVRSKDDWDHGVRLNTNYDRDAGVKDIEDTIDTVAAMSESNSRVAVLGYCIGGLMTYLTTARFSGVTAAVAFHGGDTEKYLGEASSVTVPMLMHLAGDDEFMPHAAQEAINAAFAGIPNVLIFTYPGQRHAFSRHNGEHYNADAAKLANDRTSDFLDKNLS